MIVISHRGNLAGPVPVLENFPSQVDAAIEEGFHVEVDLRVKGGDLYLGHDEPQYGVGPEWIQDRRDKLFLHLKDFDAFKLVARDAPDWTFICHSADPYTAVWAPEGYLLWLHDLSLVPDASTLVPLLSRDQLLHYEYFAVVAGVCTDYPREARALWDWMMKAPVEHAAWSGHVYACAQCLPSGGYEGACAAGADLREAWKSAEAAAK